MPRSDADVPEPTSFVYANVDELFDNICKDLPDESMLAVTFSPELFVTYNSVECGVNFISYIFNLISYYTLQRAKGSYKILEFLKVL
jgi:hypothetical protein